MDVSNAGSTAKPLPIVPKYMLPFQFRIFMYDVSLWKRPITLQDHNKTRIQYININSGIAALHLKCTIKWFPVKSEEFGWNRANSVWSIPNSASRKFSSYNLKRLRFRASDFDELCSVLISFVKKLRHWIALLKHWENEK